MTSDAGALMRISDAQRYLGVSKKKIAALLADVEGVQEPGRLTWTRDPLDGRSKLVRAAEVEALAARSAKKEAQAA
jgi:hypothetical protein